MQRPTAHEGAHDAAKDAPRHQADAAENDVGDSQTFGRRTSAVALSWRGDGNNGRQRARLLIFVRVKSLPPLLL